MGCIFSIPVLGISVSNSFARTQCNPFPIQRREIFWLTLWAWIQSEIIYSVQFDQCHNTKMKTFAISNLITLFHWYEKLLIFLLLLQPSSHFLELFYQQCILKIDDWEVDAGYDFVYNKPFPAIQHFGKQMLTYCYT